jgi:hypothetical protein
MSARRQTVAADAHHCTALCRSQRRGVRDTRGVPYNFDEFYRKHYGEAREHERRRRHAYETLRGVRACMFSCGWVGP